VLRLSCIELEEHAARHLSLQQAAVFHSSAYAHQVVRAKELWAAKISNQAGRTAFATIRSTLASMCGGTIRCCYCEDSMADEIEHIRPKDLFPALTFVWQNYLFACGPCNGPKGNRYGYLDGNHVIDFVRLRREPIRSPPDAPPALIDPRVEDPLRYLELDLGGTTPDGAIIEGTFELLPSIELTSADEARAEYTIQTLGLNREIIRVARQNAFGGYRARLHEYADRKQEGASEAELVKSVTTC
jgi:uncharacterized protein (TIGR02646 family)